MKILGLDPGLKGGLAWYDGTTLVAMYTPVLSETFIKNGKKQTRNILDLVMIRDLIEEHKPDYAVLEKVAARSGQGVTSMFRFGQGFGELRGIMTALRLPFKEVTPQTWKRSYELASDKADSLQIARELWPEHAKACFRLKKQDGVAEAALIAKYGFDNHSAMGYADPIIEEVDDDYN